MKKIWALAIILLLVPLALAQNETQNVSNEEINGTFEDLLEEGAGTLPDSPFYSLDRAIERLQLNIARHVEEKVNLRLQFALERLQEVKEMQRLRRQERINQTLDDFETEINELDAELENVEFVGINVTQLQERMQEMHQKQIQVLERVLENAPESAQPALTKVLEKARERHEIREQKFGVWAEKIQEREQEHKQNTTSDNETGNSDNSKGNGKNS